MIVPTLYPLTHRPIFQAEKPLALFLGEHDHWFYDLHKNTRAFQLIRSDTVSFYAGIKQKYINNSGTGFNVYFNDFCLGDVSKFASTPEIII
jgi:hypothetical protein